MQLHMLYDDIGRCHCFLNKCVSIEFGEVIIMSGYRGQLPSEAEANYLDNASKLSLYGVHLYQAKVMQSLCLFIFHNIVYCGSCV